MNKTDLINSIAAKSGLNKKNSEAALNALIASVEDSLKAGDKVVLVGFGTFEVRKRAARKRQESSNQEGNHNTRIKGTRVQSRQSFKR